MSTLKIEDKYPNYRMIMDNEAGDGFITIEIRQRRDNVAIILNREKVDQIREFLALP